MIDDMAVEAGGEEEDEGEPGFDGGDVENVVEGEDGDGEGEMGGDLLAAGPSIDIQQSPKKIKPKRVSTVPGASRKKSWVWINMIPEGEGRSACAICKICKD